MSLFLLTDFLFLFCLVGWTSLSLLRHLHTYKHMVHAFIYGTWLCGFSTQLQNNQVRENLRQWDLASEMGEIQPWSSSSSASSSSSSTMPLLSLNHVSFVCKSLRRSIRFYEEVLGFVLIKRPSSFNFEGAW